MRGLIFLVFNVLLLAFSLYLLYSFATNLSVMKELPNSIKIIIALGMITPFANLYDTIGNFVRLFTYVEDK